MPSSPDRPTIHLTRAHHEMWGKIYRGLMPWAAWLILTVAGFTVRVVFGHWLWLLVILVLVSGLVLAGLTLHLHANRISTVGKMIGPATTAAGSVLTAVWLMAGWSVPLLLVYFFAGVVACLGWDVWMHVGVSHDITRAFGPASEAAFGKPARLSMTRAPKAAGDPAAPARSRASRSRAPRTMTGRVMMPPEVTVSEGAERVEGLEQNLGFPPGSVTLRQSPDDPWADFTASDPHLLDVPEPWPGPSRPHGTMAEPFRMGVRQDGSTALIRRLPNYHTRGMGQTGSAKALKLDTPVPVPSGWTTMGELRDGDLVFDDAGGLCHVVKAHPVLYDRPCYEVRFSDGSAVTACADHLWEVDTRSSRLSADTALRPDLRPRKTAAHRPQAYKHALPRVVTTADLAAGLRGRHGHLEYSVRVAAPLQCPEAELPVPPYTLGAWLGDGTTQTGSITSVDREILSEVEAEGLTVRVVPSTVAPGRAALYRVAGLSRMLVQAGTRERVPARYPGKHTMRGVKHIPAAYLRASEEQRRALLAGLLDTDGTCGPSGGVVFTSTSERLAGDVLHLVSGLGYKASLRSAPARLYGRDCGTAWKVSFTPADKVFRLPRKAARQVTTVRRTALRRYVTEVRPVESVPVRCITVDSPTSLYLVGQACIPTHNTMGWGYNQLGEGVSREEYAALVFDFAKGEQFFGAWRMALHYFETEEERILRRMAGLHRARIARTNYLAKSHLTEWAPGCGLSFLDIFMAEAPDVIRLLAVGKRASAGAVMTREDWESDVKNYRSAGGSWNLDLQLSLASEMPSVAQGQMSHLTMGVEDRKQAAFGLSDRQKEGGCRPELWGKRKPGMAYWDVPTEDESLALMPLRFYHWRDGARQAFEYAQQWPAADRPLDDVTGEALEAEPALPPSYALPGPGGTLAGGGRPPAGNVRGLFDRRKPAGPTMEEKAREREQAVMRQFDEWEAAGKVTFTSLDLQATGIAQRLGVSRPWLYGVIDTATARGRLELAAGKPKRVWRIVPQQRLRAEEE